MMNEKELKKLRCMPEEFEIYRGYAHDASCKGLSWTLNKEKAIWFANRLKRRSPKLATGLIKRENVIAYFESRNEFEIVVMPDRITKIENSAV